MNQTNVPLYRQVIDGLIQRIASGALPPGSMLPSEFQIGEEFGVSQGTARKAVSELETRGIVRRVQGKGTFVTLRTPKEALFHFFRLRRPDGRLEAPILLDEELRLRAARPEERRQLVDAPGDVVEITRMRALPDGPRIHEVSVVPASLFPGLMDRRPLPNNLYVLYQQAYGIVVLRAEERLNATCAGAAMAERLGCAATDPVMQVERVAFDALDRKIELRSSTFRCDGYRYFVTLS